MPDNKTTRDKVAKANAQLTRAKQLKSKLGIPVPKKVRKNLENAIKEWEK